jgi:transcriptional regulator with XRE-family HTH domain
MAADTPLPAEAQSAVRTLGSHVSLARRRRRLKQADMADQMRVSRQTLHRLEHGDPAVSLTVLAQALHVLGLTPRLELLAAPDQDAFGMKSELAHLPQRIRSPKGE